MNTNYLPSPAALSGTVTERWLRVPLRCAAPRWRLVCFPYAGAGASAFYPWARGLADRGIEMWNLQYPGRETRLREAPLQNFAEMLQVLTEVLAPVLAGPVPVAFFGHSLGAVLAHESASRLAAQGGRPPVHLFLSGRNAPDRRSEPARLHDLPANDLLDAVAKFGNLSPAVRNEPALLELLLPVLRADFGLLHNYHYHWSARSPLPLTCPLTVLAGEQDPWTDPEGLANWRRFIRGPHRLRLYAGDHFFINPFRAEICQAVEHDLAGLVP